MQRVACAPPLFGGKRYDKTRDDINFQYVGESVDPIDWQKRPTFQQVVG